MHPYTHRHKHTDTPFAVTTNFNIEKHDSLTIGEKHSYTNLNILSDIQTNRRHALILERVAYSNAGIYKVGSTNKPVGGGNI